MERKQGYVSNRVDQILDSHVLWPKNTLKLECEGVGIYQNITGSILDELVEDSEIEEKHIDIRGNSKPFFMRPGANPNLNGNGVVEAAENLDRFFSETGHFADLVVYVALSKIHNELRDKIHIDVLPEGKRSDLLHAPGRAPDALISLPGEYVPVEVYNGGDYLSSGTRKFRQAKDLASDDDEVLDSHPMLVNRRCDDVFQSSVRKKWNGMTVNTDLILAPETEKAEFHATFKKFNLTQLVEYIPPIETADGTSLTGNEYVGLSNNEKEIIRPTDKMVDAADHLPDQYMKRVRGGVQLQYVNSFYRRHTDQTTLDGCYVLQTIYNQLLREGGKDRQTALQEGWEGAKTRYRRIKNAGDQHQKQLILEKTKNLLQQLQEEKIITEMGGKIYARKAEHPQPSLTF